MPETLFKKVDYTLSKLLHDIDHGNIGLPDLQRPFVWNHVQVRDLFDSMYRGFPVGYLLFWANDRIAGVKQIGTEEKQASVPSLLVVDGQQRLTSLYAVLRGKRVIDSEFRETPIRIAFHPPTGRFEVPEAAMTKDVEYLTDISRCWASGASAYKVVNEYLSRLRSARPLAEEDEARCAHNIDRLCDLQNYPFTALEISGSVDEEQVADIFVRINSKGVQLRQADFILTLMSVFWDQGRRRLEEFSRRARHFEAHEAPSPYNHVFQPDPDQLLRTLVAYSLKRAVLRRVYGILRGRDADSGQFSAEKRDQQFKALQAAQPEVLDLTAWHEFLKVVSAAGYRSAKQIMSANALVYAYAVFLIGRNQRHVEGAALRRLIARWFFAAAVTGRFSGSFESDMESTFSRLGATTSAQDFVSSIEHDTSLMLTSDFWHVNLPDALATSGSRTPSLYAFYASQCILKAPVLFSSLTVWELLEPSSKPRKAHLDRHHLFPRGHLKKCGVTDRKRMNQIANLTLVEWPDNIKIRDQSPAQYVPKLREQFPASTWESMARLHAMPQQWWEMPYEDFLTARRQLMAQVIREGFETI